MERDDNNGGASQASLSLLPKVLLSRQLRTVCRHQDRRVIISGRLVDGSYFWYHGSGLEYTLSAYRGAIGSGCVCTEQKLFFLFGYIYLPLLMHIT